MFRETLARLAHDAGYALSDAQLAQLTRYYELLTEWNARMNLTAITEPDDVALKHMIDSMTAYDAALFTDGARVIDVGTGAGFPGLPLKILAPGIRLTLLDSLQKRVTFLEAVTRALDLTDVTCLHGRAEDVARDSAHRGRYDIAVSRAVARLAVLLEYDMPFLREGGTFIALKGKDAAAELAEAEKAIKILGGKAGALRPVTLPGVEDRRAIITVKKVMPTPKAYPRKAGTPAKKPLG